MAEQSDMKRFKELCAGYVLNILDQDERERFERLLDDASEQQRTLYEKMRKKGNELLFSDTEIPSSEQMRERLLAEFEDGESGGMDADTDRSADRVSEDTVADESEDEASTSSSISFSMVAAVVLGIICLSLIFYSFSQRSEINGLEETIAQQEEVVIALEEDLDDVREMISVAESRQLHAVRLLGMEASPFGFGNVIWDSQNQRALVQVGELPPSSEDTQYQLWAIYDNDAVAIRSFSVDEEGNALFMTENLDDLSRDDEFSFAVTLEPAEGSSQPNGEMHLMGSFGE